MAVKTDKYVGINIFCLCGLQFYWSVEEQKYYAKNQLSPPARCQACRLKKNTKLEQERENNTRKKAARIAKLAPWVKTGCFGCQIECEVPERIVGHKRIFCKRCFSLQQTEATEAMSLFKLKQEALVQNHIHFELQRMGWRAREIDLYRAVGYTDFNLWNRCVQTMVDAGEIEKSGSGGKSDPRMLTLLLKNYNHVAKQIC
jgi:Probable zinc-ribbon domain